MSAKERLKSPRQRLFIALELPGAVLDEIEAWQRRAFRSRPDVRAAPRESLHATLVFLGYQPAKAAQRIAELSFNERCAPFELQVRAARPVPPRRPRLYALELDDPAGALGRWQGGLSEQLRRAHLYEPEKRPFWPHVTVARLKRGRQPPKLAREPEALAEVPEGLRRPFQARRVTLYRSHLKPTGAVYEPLAALELEI